MPCYDSRNDPNSPEGREHLLKSFLHNSPVAEMLCYVLRHIEHERIDVPLTPEISRWWKEHKIRDAKKAK